MRKKLALVGLGISLVTITALSQTIIQSNHFGGSIVLAQTTGQVRYVRQGNKGSTFGDGSQEKPYQSLQYALEQIAPGDTLVLQTNFVLRENGKHLSINKAVTIEGNGHHLTLSGMDLVLGANVTFQNLHLLMQRDGTQLPHIVVADHTAIFDSVNTQLSVNQDADRPILVAGTRHGNETVGAGANIFITGNTEQTRFKQIIVGNTNGAKQTPTQLTIGAGAGADEGVILGSAENPVNAPVGISNASNKVTTYLGGQFAPESRVTVETGTSLYDATFEGLHSLRVQSGAAVQVAQNFAGLTDTLQLENGASFNAKSVQQAMAIGTVSGEGVVQLPLIPNILTVDFLKGTNQIIFDTNGVLVRPDQYNQTYVTVNQADEATSRFEVSSDASIPVIKVDNRYVLQSKQATKPVVWIELYQAPSYDVAGLDLSDDYFLDEFEVNHSSNRPRDYFRRMSQRASFANKVLLNMGDEKSKENPTLKDDNQDGKIDGLAWWVMDPGHLVIDGQHTPYTIVNSNSSQTVKVTIPKPKDGYYYEKDGQKYTGPFGEVTLTDRARVENLVLVTKQEGKAPETPTPPVAPKTYTVTYKFEGAVPTGVELPKAVTGLQDGSEIAIPKDDKVEKHDDGTYILTWNRKHTKINGADVTVVGTWVHQAKGTGQQVGDKPKGELPTPKPLPKPSPKPSPKPASKLVSVYRLHNAKTKEYFYTVHIAERDKLVKQGWKLEGVAWKAETQTGAPVYRLQNLKTKEYFYTKNRSEYDKLGKQGWKQEGTAFRSHGSVAVYRLYNAKSKKYFFTRHTSERDKLVGYGWKSEGIAWLSQP